MNIFILDHIREPVGTEDEYLALVGRDLLNLYIDAGLDAKGARHIVLVCGPLRLLGRVEPAVDEFLQQRVVHRHLLELVAALTVQARVPDVRDRDLVVEEQRRDYGRAHALALRLGARGLVDDLVGAADGIAQDDVAAGQSRFAVRDRQVLALHVFAHEVDDGLHGNAAGDLARIIAAHAVGQHQKADVRIDGDGVLVVLADLTGIGQTNEAQFVAQRHASTRPACGPTNVIRVTFPSPNTAGIR